MVVIGTDANELNSHQIDKSAITQHKNECCVVIKRTTFHCKIFNFIAIVLQGDLIKGKSTLVLLVIKSLR